MTEILPPQTSKGDVLIFPNKEKRSWTVATVTREGDLQGADAKDFPSKDAAREEARKRREPAGTIYLMAEDGFYHPL